MKVVVIASGIKYLFIAFSIVTLLPVCSGQSYAQSPGRSERNRPAQGPRKSAAQLTAEFNDLAKRATEAREADRLDEAVALYGQALQIRPSWIEGWWSASTILYDRDRYAEARDAFRRLLSILPQSGPNSALIAPSMAMLGLCEFQTREYERALVELQRARLLGLSGQQQLISVVRYHAAILLTRFEQFELGFDALREFAREGNESPSVIEAFGLNVLRMPFLPSELPPDKRELVVMAGRPAYYMSARRQVESRKMFDDLLARYPETPGVHYAFGVFLLNQEPDAALEEFRHELKLSPNHVPSMLQIAFEYVKRSDYASGLPFAETSVQLAPNMFPARNALGRILLETGDVARAIKELEAGVKLAPDSPEMHFALARAYARAARKEDAARERAIFTKLDQAMRTEREGPQSVGGVGAKPTQKSPPK
jgi:tetratricopeptide (TPR) repeat protein